MKIIGTILISIGLALLLFLAYNFIRERNRLVTPIPKQEGVKVIFVTPSK